MRQGRLGNNNYAPVAYNGIGQVDVPVEYRDVSFDYVFNQTLAANQTGLQESLAIHNDSDFAWRATVINRATGVFSVRFSDSDWYWLSSDQIVSTNIQTDPASPSAVFPEIILPSGGRIGVEMSDLSGNPNTVQILFRGVKRYALA